MGMQARMLWIFFDPFYSFWHSFTNGFIKPIQIIAELFSYKNAVHSSTHQLKRNQLVYERRGTDLVAVFHNQRTVVESDALHRHIEDALASRADVFQ